MQWMILLLALLMLIVLYHKTRRPSIRPVYEDSDMPMSRLKDKA